MADPTPTVDPKHRHRVERDARATWGDAWRLLSPEQQAGARALAALHHLAGQDESVPADRVRALLMDLHEHVVTSSDAD